MLDALLSDMIGDELLRNPSFIQTPIEDYCRKLANRASIIIHFDSQKPLGMIAYYCNDLKTGSIYISSIIVDPEARRGGGRPEARSRRDRPWQIARISALRAGSVGGQHTSHSILSEIRV